MNKFLLTFALCLALLVPRTQPVRAEEPADVPEPTPQLAELVVDDSPGTVQPGPLELAREVPIPGATFIDRGSVASFRKQGAAFWTGGFELASEEMPTVFPSTTLSRPPLAGCGQFYPCDLHRLVIEKKFTKASRLRVAIDASQGRPANEDAVDLVIVGPDGQECRGPMTSDHFQGAEGKIPLPWSFEAILEQGVGEGFCATAPGPGTYRIVVIGAMVESRSSVDDGQRVLAYRARAGLEATQTSGASKVMLPDLTVPLPPSDPEVGCIAGDTNKVEGQQDCLRFTFTYANTGEGMLDLQFETTAVDLDPLGRRTVTQVSYLSDRTPRTYDDNVTSSSDAGSAFFHESHRHWHLLDFYETTLLRKVGDQFEVARVGGKPGLCTSAWFMSAFDSFIHDAPDVGSSTGCNAIGSAVEAGPAGEPVRIPLPNGWADYYLQGTPDNFMDMAGLPSGEYVLSFRLNPRGKIRELRGDNNSAYLHVRWTAATDGQPATVVTVGRGHGDLPQ